MWAEEHLSLLSKHQWKENDFNLYDNSTAWMVKDFALYTHWLAFFSLVLPSPALLDSSFVTTAGTIHTLDIKKMLTINTLNTLILLHREILNQVRWPDDNNLKIRPFHFTDLKIYLISSFYITAKSSAPLLFLPFMYLPLDRRADKLFRVL